VDEAAAAQAVNAMLSLCSSPFACRRDTWFNAHVAESAADATGVTWPSEKITKMWKFFFKVRF
jgi:hypothetical protein